MDEQELLAGLGERVVDDYTYVETIGATSREVRHLVTITREPDAIVRRVGDQETHRWDERGFLDYLLDEPHTRAKLGLAPAPEAAVIDRTIARLHAGHRFRSGGSDDGGRSGRGISGGWQELYMEGDRFIDESVSFYQPTGGEPEYDRQRRELDEPSLREALAGNNYFRVLIGLTWR